MDHSRRTGGLMTHGISEGAFARLSLFDTNTPTSTTTNNGPSLMISQITPRAMSERILAPKLAPVLSSSPSSRFKLDATLSPLIESSLEFGFLPKQLVAALQDKDWKVRSDSIDQFLDIASRIDDTIAIIPHLVPLIKLLNKLLTDSNFTICLTTIRIIGDLFPKFQVSIKPYLSSFLPNLIEVHTVLLIAYSNRAQKFGDSKIIIRQETLKVVSKLMNMASPTPVLEVMLDSCGAKHWHIKQHTLFVIIKALLTFKDHRFDYGMIVTAMVPLLQDTKPKVKHMAIEVLAVVQHTLGSQLDPMLGNLDQELLKVLHKRFSKGQLPIICPDGSVELQLKDTEEEHPRDGSTTPSLPSTPHHLTHSSNGSNEDTPEVQLRPVRHWSAGAKITTRTKLPPWFPGSPTPSSPFPTDDSPSTGARKGPVRTRSYSVSTQDHTPNLPPLSPQQPPPVPLGFASHSQAASRSMSPSLSPLNSPTGLEAYQASPSPSPFFSPVHNPNPSSVYGNSTLDPGARYSPSLGKVRGGGATTSVYYPQIVPTPAPIPSSSKNPCIDDEEDLYPPPKSVYRKSGSLSPSGNYSPVVEKRRSPVPGRRRESITDSSENIPIVDNSLLENIEDMPLYDIKPSRKNSLLPPDDESDGLLAKGSVLGSDSQSDSNLLAPSRTNIRSRSPLKTKIRSRSFTDPTPSPAPIPIPSGAKQPRVVNTSPSEIIPTEGLTPVDNPDAELKLALDWFAHGEWYNQFEACCSIRRLVVHHPKAIAPQIHDIVTAILAAANNLRSLVSRHALVCLGDLFKFQGKQMEPYLDEVVIKIIKKYMESNSFIEKELDRAMSLMIDNVSETRSLAVLLQVSNHKSAIVRAKVAFLFSNLLEIIGKRVWEMREIDKIIPIVAQLVQEGSGDARAHGRKALYVLYSTNPTELEKLLKKVCSDSLQRRVREILDKIKNSGPDALSVGTVRKPSKTPTRTLRNTSSPPPSITGYDEEELNGKTPAGSGYSTPTLSRTPSGSGYATPVPSRTPSGSGYSTPTLSRYGGGGSLTPVPHVKAQDQQRSGTNTPVQMSGKDPQEFETLPTIFSGMDSSEWRMRHEAIIAMVELVQKYPSRIGPRLVKIFDHFAPRLTDSNSKVNVFALHSLKQLVPLLRGGLEPVLGILIPPLAANLASSKQDVRTLTIEVFDLLVSHVDNTVLIPYFTLAAANHANVKVKVAILQHLADIVGAVYQYKSQVVVKHVLPFAFKLLDERKGEMRTVNSRLLKNLYQVMGDALWDTATALSKQDQLKLQEILSS